jgi:Protein of unknown function (DUF2934)
MRRESFCESISKETNMSSKAAIIGITDPTEPDTAAEEREGLLHSSREQEIRNRAYEIYLQRGEQSGYELGDWLQAEREIRTN